MNNQIKKLKKEINDLKSAAGRAVPARRRRGKASNQIRAPIAATRVFRGEAKPQVRTEKNTEFVATVAGSTSYGCISYSCNPGNSSCFPWFYQIALAFDYYNVHRVTFHYRNRCPTSTTGYVGLFFDCDPDDAPPTSLAHAATSPYFVQGAPWNDFSLSVNKDAFMNFGRRLGVRNLIQSFPDLKLYDFGKLYVITDAQANTNVIGNLYIEYHIDTLNPQVYSMNDSLVAMYYMGADQSFATTVAEVLGSSGEIYTDVYGLGITETNGVFSLPKGYEYEFRLFLNAFDDTAEAFNVNVGTVIDGGARSAGPDFGTQDQLQVNCSAVVKVDCRFAIKTFAFSLVMTAVAGAMIAIADTMHLRIKRV
jgi:hypothetical protein